MIDVFFCTMAGDDPVRRGIANACLARWRELEKDGECNVTILEPIEYQYYLGAETICPSVAFQRERRIAAERRANGHVFIVADDDMMPLVDHLLEAEAIMHRHPHFGKLAFMPSNAYIAHWTPETYSVYEDNDVMEHVSVGGIYLARKVFDLWPQSERHNSFDQQHGEAMRALGYRVGFFKNIRANHFGEGLSTVWPSARRLVHHG